MHQQTQAPAYCYSIPGRPFLWLLHPIIKILLQPPAPIHLICQLLGVSQNWQRLQHIYNAAVSSLRDTLDLCWITISIKHLFKIQGVILSVMHTFLLLLLILLLLLVVVDILVVRPFCLYHRTHPQSVRLSSFPDKKASGLINTLLQYPCSTDIRPILNYAQYRHSVSPWL